MNPTALTIAIAYIAVCIVAIAFMMFIWRSTHSATPRRDDTVDTGRLAHGEKTWFMIAVAALGVLLLATLPFIPYGKNSAEAGQQLVMVEAVQFAWIMQPNTIQAGVPTRFTVQSTDVSHGFAVYDDRNVMLFQVQSLPDHATDIVHTFKDPGTYQVVCLEYCGLSHHKMLGILTVEPANPQERA
jgi:cytochrome c oxidase subunit II